MKYKIGDVVWYAQVKCFEGEEPCPDCFGQRALTVIKGDGSQVSIECVGCMAGYEPSKGYVKYYGWKSDVLQVRIERVEITDKGIEYGHSQSYRVDGSELFDTKEEAEKLAEEKWKAHNAAEIAKIHQKEKHNRTWSWNANYHRDCIKRAEKDLVYHTAKLNVAKVKSKEEKNVLTPKPIGRVE